MVSFTNETLSRNINVSDHISNELMREIQRELDFLGLYYRLFGRTKSIESIRDKLNKKSYLVGHKMMQDIIGLRIAVYFNDDIDLCRNILKNMYQLDNEQYDHPSTEEFKPIRINMVFRLPEKYLNQMTIGEEIPIDRTFEVQVRTVFSEGWHEIEHDLRYKRKDDWEGLSVHSRMLNGIFATLDTCDLSIIQLFDRVAHDHYVNKRWIPMCINHFRMKFPQPSETDGVKIERILNYHMELAKAILRYDRLSLTSCLRGKYNNIPHSLLNIIYIINLETVHIQEIIGSTPELILEAKQHN